MLFRLKAPNQENLNFEKHKLLILIAIDIANCFKLEYLALFQDTEANIHCALCETLRVSAVKLLPIAISLITSK
jgi:hypothetical protein